MALSEILILNKKLKIINIKTNFKINEIELKIFII